MGLFFGDHVTLSESVWFTGGEEKLIGPLECELLSTSWIVTLNSPILCSMLFPCCMSSMLYAANVSIYVMWAAAADLPGCLHCIHVLDHVWGRGCRSRRCPGWWCALQGFLIWKMSSFKSTVGGRSFLHSSSPGSIGLQVYVNTYESMYDISWDISAHTGAYKCIYGI